MLKVTINVDWETLANMVKIVNSVPQCSVYVYTSQSVHIPQNQEHKK